MAIRATETVEDRVAGDLAYLEQLRLIGFQVPQLGAWKKSIGWAKDDPLHQEAVRLGAEWRKSMNQETLEETFGVNANS